MILRVIVAAGSSQAGVVCREGGPHVDLCGWACVLVCAVCGSISDNVLRHTRSFSGSRPSAPVPAIVNFPPGSSSARDSLVIA